MTYSSAAPLSEEVIGLDGELRELGERLRRIALSDATVLLRGESGTGKELFARELHRKRRRSDQPFVRTNCAALAPGLLESELFGHEAGAFTGAKRAHIGRFEKADGGTLLLDEIGDLPLPLQAKLLRAIQEREIERVGGRDVIPVNIRIIAATHRSLESMVAEGSFRADLFYRLNVIPLHMPRLRDRLGDIRPLACYFTQEFAKQSGKNVQLSADAVEYLIAQPWPGNVRELRNVIERAVVLADDHTLLGPESFECDTELVPPARCPLQHIDRVVSDIEIEELRDAMLRSRGNKTKAAELLGIPRTTLYYRLHRLAHKQT